MMKKNSIKDSLCYKLLRASFGLVGYTVGLYLTIKANIGVAPWDVFALGLGDKLSITLGQATIFISIVVVIADILLGERIGWGTVLDAIIVGSVLDFLEILIPIPEFDNIIVSIVMIIVGLFIMAFFQFFYMSAALSCGPRDTFLVGIGRLLPKIPIGGILVGIEAIVLIIGCLLGGQVGIGTIICVVCTGGIMQIVFNLIKFEPREVIHQGLHICRRVEAED